jgi:NAD(P)H-dependent FMN reductase
VPLLQVVIGSTRPGRVGLPVAEWFNELAGTSDVFDVELVDLAEVDLPVFDEPHHPKLGRYEHEHTRAWSAIVDRADAFVFVVPEYNYGFNAATKNAIDYLHAEWKGKPVGFVSYGGVAAGTRAVQMLKQVVTTLSMVPVFESVNIPFVEQFLEGGRFVPNDVLVSSAHAMLSALATWESALRPLRIRS